MQPLAPTSATTTLEYTLCPLCHGETPEPVYTSSQECGPFLGTIPITLCMCQECGFLYQNPRPSRDLLDRYYQHEATASGNIYYRTDVGSRFEQFNNRRLFFFRRHWPGPVGKTPSRVLDIGCGAGHFLASLRTDGHHLYGLEPSEKASAKASSKGLNVVNTGIDNHPFANAFFDVIFSHSVLEHVRDIDLALSSVHRILKPSGSLFIEVPDSTRPIPEAGEFFSFEHLSHFTLGTLSHLLIKNGFRIVALTADEDSPRLRACATLSTTAHVQPAIADDRMEMKRALALYRDQRQILRTGIRERLDTMVEKWRKTNFRIGIFGAGIHTHNLLSMSRLGEVLSAVLDSDIRKSGTAFLSWTVHSPAELAALNLDLIIISSKAFQDEIWTQLLPLQRCLGFDMVKLYA